MGFEQNIETMKGVYVALKMWFSCIFVTPDYNMLRSTPLLLTRASRGIIKQKCTYNTCACIARKG